MKTLGQYKLRRYSSSYVIEVPGPIADKLWERGVRACEAVLNEEGLLYKPIDPVDVDDDWEPEWLKR